MALVLIKYGFDNPAERIKINTTKEEDSVVLIQNGVFWALKEDIEKKVKGKIYAIKEDFLARGYSEKDSHVKLIDYSSFMDIIEKEEKFIG